MFGQITEKFQTIIRSVRGLGKITDRNIKETVREVRKTLLDSDINFKVVKSFIAKVEAKAQGTKVLKSVKPGEQFVKIIRDELVTLLGSETKSLALEKKPSVVILAGLQGAGKTTSAGKLAYSLKKSGKSVLLATTDIYRPAAIDQLNIIGRQIGVDVFADDMKSPINICSLALEKSCNLEKDVLILDTAGRLHINEKMMNEVQSISTLANPSEILFVADGMTGQDAVNSAIAFHRVLSLTGIILTKMDGDSRGGAAVSINYVTGVPIKFIGTSEGIDGLEVFDPLRVANRILGFGDVISLVEKAQKVFDQHNVDKIKDKIKLNSFDLNDFNNQLNQIKKMGSFGQTLKMLPSMNSKIIKTMNMDDRQLIWTEAIINSMTLKERKMPNIIDGSRRLRIAKGSGRSVQEVNSLLNQFQYMKKMMKKIKNLKQINFPGLGNLNNFK